MPNIPSFAPLNAYTRGRYYDYFSDHWNTISVLTPEQPRAHMLLLNLSPKIQIPPNGDQVIHTVWRRIHPVLEESSFLSPAVTTLRTSTASLSVSTLPEISSADDADSTTVADSSSYRASSTASRPLGR